MIAKQKIIIVNVNDQEELAYRYDRIVSAAKVEGADLVAVLMEIDIP